ncbi:MAG: sigma-70 family RNA polymerase sigma factor [Hydrogenophilaceae bacterium]|jgi:RNA polymerase sigma-70 factor (ECF subfamily)|nr:sigma-70 family RNA polymerase sigma factor [Hydrogenophilaceae bacterium]
MSGEADPFHAHRGRLLGLAYRMLGSRADAEDAVQDAWLRWAACARGAVANAEAYLVTTVTRICLDKLKSARAKREIYVGPWLPEPVLDADALSPHAATELAEDLSFALLLALERLSPLERAAFLLHDVFDAPYADVAETLGRSEEAVRQLASRARKAVRDERRALPATTEAHEKLIAAFVAAVATGDEAGLKALLREDAVTLSDGGGKRAAALNPICGADKTARFLLGLARKYAAAGAPLEPVAAIINGAPGLLLRINGALDQAVCFSIDGDRIAAIYIVRNPEKLGALMM